MISLAVLLLLRLGNVRHGVLGQGWCQTVRRKNSTYLIKCFSQTHIILINVNTKGINIYRISPSINCNREAKTSFVCVIIGLGITETKFTSSQLYAYITVKLQFSSVLELTHIIYTVTNRWIWSHGATTISWSSISAEPKSWWWNTRL